MDKQVLARRRNLLKRNLAAIPNVPLLSGFYLSEEEIDILRDIQKLITEFNEGFEDASRSMGLNVPKIRCSYGDCSRDGKYKFKYDHYCYKHLKMKEGEGTTLIEFDSFKRIDKENGEFEYEIFNG